MKVSRMRNISAIAMLLLTASYTFAQAPPGENDKYTLLTMPFNLRQLTLYKGQFAINAGYKFAVRSQQYDSNGKKQLLTNSGTGSVYHYYLADIRYGITDFLELGAETNFIRHGMRAQSETYVSTTATGTERVTVNKLAEVKGLGDILLKFSIRPPVRYRWFDMSATGGLFLPSSKYEPDKPKDNLINTAVANSYLISSYNKYTNGYGVPVYLLSGSVKTNMKRLTFTADFTFRTPVHEGKNIRWVGTMIDKQFTYYNKTYQYLLSNEYSVNAAFHYQMTGWFDLYLNGNWHMTKGGWTDYWGNKYKNPQTHLVTLEPGFELQISPSLTIYQVAGFPLAGKNCDAPFYLFTTIRFSNFLFSR
jgi:hypothetical protein